MSATAKGRAPLDPGPTNIVLAGFGRVGRAFAHLLAEKRFRLRERYSVDLRLASVLDSEGGVMAPPGPAGLDPTRLREIPLGVHEGWRRGLGLAEVLTAAEPGVLVECIAAHPETGEPALGYLKMAMDQGWQAVTASKGPLAAEGKALRARAAERGISFKFSGAAGAALPAADIGLFSLAGAEVLGIEGIFNGTTNFILTGMRKGQDYDHALAEARRLGIAEPDPRRDVEGWDTAVKLLVLSNLVFDEDRKIGEVRVRGLAGLTPAELRRGAEAGFRVKLLGRALRANGSTELGVEPVSVDKEHPLFSVEGAEKGVTFVTDILGTVTVIGGKSDPRAAAASMLKDIIRILSSAG